jgi:hypothetical protein
MSEGRLEVKPKGVFPIVVLSSLAILAVSAIRVVLLTPEVRLGTKLLLAAAGLLSVVVLILMLVFLWTRPYSLVLTQRGIELGPRSKRSFAFIPWPDIDTIAVIKVKRIKVVAIRLSSYRRFARSARFRNNEQVKRVGSTIRLIFSALNLMRLMPSGGDYATTLEANHRQSDAILDSIQGELEYADDYIEVTSFESDVSENVNETSIIAMLEQRRSVIGCDVTLIPWVDTDRSAEEFVLLLKEWKSTWA